MSDLGDSLRHMGFVQLTLLFGFLTSYVLALGRMLGTAARLRAGLLTLLSAAGFVSTTTPWEHGALLVVFVIGGLGLFVAAVWLLAAVVGPRAPVVHAAPVAAGAAGAAGSRPARLPGVAAPDSTAGALR